MLPEFGGDSYTYADNFMTGRANGVATYRNSDFFGTANGLNFALQYQGKNEDQSSHEYNPSASQKVPPMATAAMLKTPTAMASVSPLPMI